MNKLVSLPVRFPKSALAAVLALTLFFALQVPKVTINNNPWDFLPSDTPERIYYDEMTEKFGTKDMAFVALVSEAGIFHRETLKKIDTLTSSLASMDILDDEDDEWLDEAIDLSGNRAKAVLESVRAAGLDRSSTGELNRAISLLDESSPGDSRAATLLAGIISDIEPFEDVTSLTSVEHVRGTEWGLEVGPLVDDVDLDDDALKDLEARVLADDLYRGLIVSDDVKATLIMADLAFPETDSDRCIRLYHRMKSIIEPEIGPERIYIAGVPMASALSGEYVNRDLTLLMPAAIAMVVVVLFCSFGTIMGVALPLAVVLMSVIWALGALAWTGTPLSMVLSSMPMLLIAVGSAYGIHIMSGYYEALLKAKARGEAARQTMMELWKPVVMACLTTAVGFGALKTSSVIPVQHFGIFTAFGVFSAMIFAMVFVPAVLALWGPDKLRSRRIKGIKGENLLAAALAALGRGVARHRLLIVVLFVLFIVAAGAATTRITVGEDWMANFAEESEIRVADTVVRQHLGGVGTLNVVMSADGERSLKDPVLLAKMDRLQRRLEATPGVGKTLSLADYVKVINRAMNGDDPAYYRIPAEVETVTVEDWQDVDGVEVEVSRQEQVSGGDQIAQYLLMYESSGGAELGSVVDYTYRTGQIFSLLRTAYTVERGEILEATNRYIAEIFAGDDDITFKLTGLAALDMVVVRLLIRGQILSLMLSLVICFLIIAFVYRSIRVGIVCIAPLVLTTLMNFAVIVLTGNTLNTGTALTASITIGIGIDYGIHFVSRYRLLRSEGLNYEDAVAGTMQTTGKAIIFNAVSVTAGLLVLLFSVFVPVAAIGWLASLVMLSSALGALTVVPAILPYLLPEG